jgi:hypothetical protein
VAPVVPVKSNVTIVAPITVIGATQIKVSIIDISVTSATPGSKPPAVKIDAESEKLVTEVIVVDGKLLFTPETGFSGKKTVTVTITENGKYRIVQIPLTVLPEAVTKAVFTPTAANRSIIRWTESPNADGYTVFLITPFHNMALMCPDTTAADVDAHTKAFHAMCGDLVL